ncbi:MAG: hypothetical protein AAB211_02015 [Pseudomonadota bacterium]
MNIRKTVLGAWVVLGLTAISSVPVVIAAEEEQVVIEDLSVPELRAEIEKIQAEFYRVFNTLNENDDFDVECQRFTPTGSNIPQLGCEPNFVSKRRGANANDYRLGTDELISNDALIKELQPEFEQLTALMNELASQNEYFGELGQILQMLRGRLNELSQ